MAHRARRACSILALTLGAFGSPARAAWEAIPSEAWKEPARPDSGGGDAIMLLERSEYSDEQGKFRYEYFGRARVFTPEGRSMGNIEIPYLKGRWKLRDVRARSVQPNGRITEFDPTQLVETTTYKYGDYDLVRASIAVPGVEPGCIVEWAFTSEGAAEEFGGWRFRFADDVYTCVSTHTWHSSKWSSPTAVARSWRYAGIQPAFVEEKCEPDRQHPQTVTFTVRCVPGVKGEELAPPAEDASPRVTVFYGTEEQTTMYWATWKNWIDSYQDGVSKERRRLDDLIRGIRAQHPAPESALAVTFRWVQQHWHSVRDLPWERRAAEVTITKSYRPAHSVDELMDRSEALPYEINLVMILAAQQLGLDAALGMVGDRRYGCFDYKTRGEPPWNFITVVQLPGRVVYLSPDSRFAPFESVPWSLRGGDCLISGHTNDLIRKIPPDAGERAVARWGLRIHVDPEGAVDGRLEAHLSGEEAAQWKRDLWEHDPATWVKFLDDRLAESDGPRTTFERPDLSAPPDSEFVLRATARWPGITSVAGDRVIVPLDRLIPWRTRARFQPERRRQSILFRDARTEVIRAEIELTPGMTVERLPEPQQFSNYIGSWSVRWSQQQSVVTVERWLSVDRAEVPAQDYRAARELFRNLEQADQAVLLVSKQP